MYFLLSMVFEGRFCQLTLPIRKTLTGDLIYDIQIFKIIKLLTIHPPSTIIASELRGKGGHIREGNRQTVING